MKLKIDLMGVMNLVGIAMSAVQKVKSASGKEKESAVISTVQELLPAVESAAGLDFVNDAKLNGLLSDYIAARKALAQAISDAKELHTPDKN